MIGEKFSHKGFDIKIIQDSDVEAPENDDGLFIVTTRNRYFEVLHDGKDARTCMEDKELCKQYWIFPLNAYIHSGVSLSLSSGYPYNDQWDGGQIGFVFAAKSEWRYRTRELKKCCSAQTAAAGHVQTWNQFLSGDVWGYDITQDDEDIDSCWGFYGLEYCKQEAITTVEYHVKRATKADQMEASAFAI